MNRKNMPLLLMLIAGACTCIITLVRSYSVLASLVALFAVMLLFYCLGSAIRLLLDRFDRQNEEKEKQEQEIQRKHNARHKAKLPRRTVRDFLNEQIQLRKQHYKEQ